jgi:hypothetical protein
MKRYLSPLLAFALTASAAHAATPAANTFGDELNLNSPVVQKDAGLPVLTVNGIAEVLAEQADLATLYFRAIKAQDEARAEHLLAEVKAIRAERAAVLADLEKSLVEREAARAEADTAMPEDSPAAIPFSISRPDELVSTDVGTAVDAINLNMSPASLSNTPEPYTWALFGLGAALMIFVVPQQTVRSNAVAVKSN